MAWTGAGILAMLDQLATCTDEAGQITRLFLSPAHARGVAMVRGWMEAAGLATTLDASATLTGTQRAPAGTPRLLIGSHIDTVRNAGRYDGCLGVAMGVALAARLRGAHLPYALEIRAFGDEEGVRFPVTLTGARAAAGTFDPAWLSIADAQGLTLAEALENFGGDAQAMESQACRARDAFAYLEIHIEQGPVLEAAQAPLGVVTAISGAARWEVRVAGRAGHAGTVPMGQRQDALVAAAAMVLAVRQVAMARPGVVATVGRLSVAPGAANVIPAACTFTIDLRAPQDALREAAWGDILAALHAIAKEHRTPIVAAPLHAAPAVACDARLQKILAGTIGEAGLPVLHLPSGAGHDAMAVAALCPIGMLFVRCAGGISHHPDEAVTEQDVDAALDVMLRTLHKLNPADFVARTTD